MVWEFQKNPLRTRGVKRVDVETIEIDLRSGGQFSPDFMAINLSTLS